MNHKTKKDLSFTELRVLGVFLFLVILGAFLSFNYYDFLNTVENSNILLKTIQSGKILDFYEISVKEATMNYAANYNFLIYIIFAIWQSPAYFITRLFQVEYFNCVPAMLWSKALIVVFSMVSCIYMRKIVYLCLKDRKKEKLLSYLFYSSLFCVFPIFICAQIDIISITFMLCGIYHYIKENHKRFWLFFLLSVPCKMFSLLVALPLILWKHKNLIKVTLLWASLTGLLILEKIMFRNSTAYQYLLGAQSKDAINDLMGSVLVLGRDISLFFVVYLGILLYAYLAKKVEIYQIIYMVFLMWGVFVTTCNINAYWVILMAPFCVMCICIKSRFLKASILVETIGSVAYFFSVITGGSWVFRNNEFLSYLCLRGWSASWEVGRKYEGLCQLFIEKGWDQYNTLFSSVFVAAVIALLILTNPWMENGKEEDNQLDPFILCLRPCLLLVTFGCIVYAAFVQTNPVAIDMTNDTAVASNVDLISRDQDLNFEEKMVFDQDISLEELTLKFINTHPSRANAAILCVKLQDEDGKCLYNKEIGCCDIMDQEEYKISLKGTKVSAGQTYILQLSGKTGIQYYAEEEQLYPFVLQNGHLYYRIK